MNMENGKTIFNVKYDGIALANNEMNVKEFAPALLSIGELLEEANNLLNSGKAKVDVNIKATKEGSVKICLSVVQNLLQQAASLFNSDGINAVINAKELLLIIGIAGGGGVIGLIKWIKNRKIKNVIKLSDGNFKMELQDKEIRICKEVEINLFRMLSIRKKLETFIKNPLDKEGIDSVTFSSGDKVEGMQKITKEEKDYFIVPEAGQELIDDRDIETNLTIINISFQADGKWKFSDGLAVFFADIEDFDFISSVQKNQAAFAKDDILKVVLHRKQFIFEGNIKTEYIVRKVIDHRSAAVQIELPFG